MWALGTEKAARRVARKAKEKRRRYYDVGEAEWEESAQAEILGQTELEARRLQEALVLQEREEIARTKMAVGHEAAEYRQRCNQEAELEINRRQATANCTIEE